MLDIRPSFPITLPQRSRNERSSSGRTREKKREEGRGRRERWTESRKEKRREKRAAYT